MFKKNTPLLITLVFKQFKLAESMIFFLLDSKAETASIWSLKSTFEISLESFGIRGYLK